MIVSNKQDVIRGITTVIKIIYLLQARVAWETVEFNSNIIYKHHN
jgi:hypothetical protein